MNQENGSTKDNKSKHNAYNEKFWFHWEPLDIALCKGLLLRIDKVQYRLEERLTPKLRASNTKEMRREHT